MYLKKRFLALILLGAVMLFLGGHILGQSELAAAEIPLRLGDDPEEVEIAFNPFWETLELIREDYFDQPLDEDVLPHLT